MALKRENKYAEMVFSCSEDQQYRGEKVLEDHALVRVVSGELKVIQADKIFLFNAGDTLLFPRNQLSTLVKTAKDGRDYKSIVIRLASAQLREYYTKNKYNQLHAHTVGILPLEKNVLLESFVSSVLPYFDLDKQLPQKILALKITEAVEILRNINTDVDSILSDFTEPGRINLQDFMEKNYIFNIPLVKFSALTGRSLTTFKRDFEKAFHLTPQRWLTQKRLELAHYYISENHLKPINVYYEVGFENLSHFSRAFKKHFGYPPTSINQG
ncbi:AraC family transcriptional regulator [Pedobacter sp. UYP1]|uniref:helix-turn-helix domain-containing protein n=1 Tax=Pedobacter sp. UYP1 TaxID=1756396 RepID=UPI00339B190A